MKKDDSAVGEVHNTKITKPKRAVALPVLAMHDIKIPTDATETKQLTSIIKILQEKNNLSKGTDITVIAAKTIKAVEISQRAGSDSFKREATKSLINLRDLISKSDVISPKRIKTLVDRFDAVSLDAKNAAFYMLETAKIQSGDIHKKAKSSAKDTTIESKGKAKLIIAAAESNAKKITAAARTKATDRLIDASVEEKEKKVSLKESIDKKKKQADENIKVRIDKAKETAIAIIKTSDDSKQQVKLEKFKAMSDLYIEKAKNKLANDAQKESNREHLKDRRQKQNDVVRDRLLSIRNRQEEHAAKMKAIESNAKADNKAKTKDKKEEEKLIKDQEKKQKKKALDKKIARDDRSKKFNSNVMEGVYDANPLLRAGVNIFGGVKDGIGRAMDWHKERKETKAADLIKNEKHQPISAPSLKRNKEVVDNLKLQKINSTGTTVLGGRSLSAANDEKKPKLSLVPKSQPQPKLTTVPQKETTKSPFSLIKNKASNIFSKKPKQQPMASTSKMPEAVEGSGGGAGMVSGIGKAAGAAEAGEVGIAAGAAELAGGAMAAGGALVAGIAALSEIILPVIAIGAGIAGVVGLAKHFFGGSDSEKPSNSDVSGKISTKGNNGGSGDWKNSIAESDKPSQYARIAAKQSAIDEIVDSNGVSNGQTKNAGNVSVTTDNSVRSSNTTIIQEKLTTRNDDAIYQRFGYGVVAA